MIAEAMSGVIDALVFICSWAIIIGVIVAIVRKFKARK
jgi:hypothetical protein